MSVWLGRVAFVPGGLLIGSALLKLLFPSLLFWAVDPAAMTAFRSDAPGLPTFVLIGSAPGAPSQFLFPYSLPFTLGSGIALAAPVFTRQRRTRARVLGLACIFTAAAWLSHISVWKYITPLLPGPMLVTGLLAAVLAGCIVLIWERDGLHRRIRDAASQRGLDTDAALADIERRLARADQTTNLAHTQLRETAAQDERNRLARDLHDTIKQQLFSINMAAATAQTLAKTDPNAAMEMVQEVRNLSQQAQVEMKALLTQLRPAPLATIGLVQAIGDQLEALHFRSEVRVELSGSLPEDESRLPLGAQEAIFRVTQEALSNIARHARATTASVTLLASDTHLRVRIADNGQGFDAATADTGMGLGNMRARITEVGGSLSVQSAPGAGAVIEITLPLAATAQELPADSRHFLLDRFLGTVQTNAVSVVLIVFAVTFFALFAYGASQGLQSGAQSGGLPDEFTGNPLLYYALLGLLLVSMIAVPVLAIGLQIVVRIRRRRLKRIAGAVAGWGDAFRPLLHLDDKWYLAAACGTAVFAATISRNLVSSDWATALGAGAVLAAAGAIWLLIRLAQDARDLRDNTLMWATRPWLRARVGEFVISSGYQFLILFDMIRNLPAFTVGSLLSPVNPDQWADHIVTYTGLLTLIITIAGGTMLLQANRAIGGHATLPNTGRDGLTRADRISLTLQALFYIAAVALHFLSPSLAQIAPLLTLGTPIIFGLTRAASPLPAAAARFKHRI